MAAFSAYSAYQPGIGPCRTHWTPTVVRALVKEDGISNFNAVCFLRVYRQEQHNALVLLRERPGDYLGTRYDRCDPLLPRPRAGPVPRQHDPAAASRTCGTRCCYASA